MKPCLRSMPESSSRVMRSSSATTIVEPCSEPCRALGEVGFSLSGTMLSRLLESPGSGDSPKQNRAKRAQIAGPRARTRLRARDRSPTKRRNRHDRPGGPRNWPLPSNHTDDGNRGLPRQRATRGSSDRSRPKPSWSARASTARTARSRRSNRRGRARAARGRTSFVEQQARAGG